MIHDQKYIFYISSRQKINVYYKISHIIILKKMNINLVNYTLNIHI